jgi:hypothetical protein
MGRTCGTYGEKRNYRALAEKPEGRRPLWRPRRRWEKNNKIDLWDWIDLAQDGERWQAFVNFLSTSGHVSFSRRRLLHGVSINMQTSKKHCSVKNCLLNYTTSPAFPGVKVVTHGIDHPPPSSTESKEQSYTSTPTQAFVACCRANFTFMYKLVIYPQFAWNTTQFLILLITAIFIFII